MRFGVGELGAAAAAASSFCSSSISPSSSLIKSSVRGAIDCPEARRGVRGSAELGVAIMAAAAPAASSRDRLPADLKYRDMRRYDTVQAQGRGEGRGDLMCTESGVNDVSQTVYVSK
jgi:hypothetical protein